MRVKEYKHIQPEEATCNRCGATLEYCPADVQVHPKRDDLVRYITCPVCGKGIRLDSVREMFASHPAEKVGPEYKQKKEEEYHE